MGRRAVYLSTGALAAPSLRGFLEAAAAADIRAIELSSGLAHGGDLTGTVEQWRGQNRFLVHNYFPPAEQPFVLNLASADDAIAEASLSLGRQALALSARLGAAFYSIHSGFCADPIPASLGRRLEYGPLSSRGDAYQRFLDRLALLLESADTLGVDLLIEPNVLAPFNLANGRNSIALMCEAWEFDRLFADLPNQRLGVLLDTGHLMVTAATLGFDRDAFVDAVAGRIRAFHVHENDTSADQHRPLSTDGWPLRVIRQDRFAALPAIVEARYPDAAAAALQMRLVADHALPIEAPDVH